MANDLSTLKEMSMIDIAFEILKESTEPMNYRELIDKVFEVKEFSDQQRDDYISHLYTDLNTDGRFICVRRGMWGLKSWYPVDCSTDASVAANMQDDFLMEDKFDSVDLDEDFATDLIEEDEDVFEVEDAFDDDDDKDLVDEDIVDDDLDEELQDDDY